MVSVNAVGASRASDFFQLTAEGRGGTKWLVISDQCFLEINGVWDGVLHPVLHV